MAAKMYRINLLGAFEMQGTEDVPVHDGLILGSRRSHRGFVLETSRENVELIVSASAPEDPEGFPVRMPLAIAPFLERMGASMLRVELRPTQSMPEALDGTYIQGRLVLRDSEGRVRRLLMSATEAIQVSIAHRLPMMAEDSLLQLDIAPFLAELDSYREEVQEDHADFKHFVDNVTASDFARYMRERPDEREEG